jgi:hypothetical protein
LKPILSKCHVIQAGGPHVYTSVGWVPAALVGENCQFWFWLARTDLESGLNFRTKIRTRFEKKENQTGIGFDFQNGNQNLSFEELQLELDSWFHLCVELEPRQF